MDLVRKIITAGLLFILSGCATTQVVEHRQISPKYTVAEGTEEHKKALELLHQYGITKDFQILNNEGMSHIGQEELPSDFYQ